MPGNRIILIFSVGGIFALLILSNLSAPPVPLVFLGMEMPALPLGVWIGGAIASGAITSFVLQFLSYIQSGDWQESRFNRVSPSSRGGRSQGFSTEKPKTSYSQANSANRTSNSASDWDKPADKDWNFNDEGDDKSKGETSDYEQHQQPSKSSKTGSVYSYSYRETSKSGVDRADEVYDANYRVIIPPYQKSAPPSQEDKEENEDEDWGFEDDDDFNFDDSQDTKGKG
ncbi:MAG TPA: hypothetical protein DEG17_03045 [Cyanobacteria bacterium UBA11149]|nr:hypothetical protein [Cyanobacteria bacterium UBA11367]HBE57348.1 hypothetical protein [Cyanobacteria bacterium UBA11366]HBK63600.1 hypothetical protein [Cyanobacteria bacterium UBA11166]HBR75597.1 hypothetical protein [Cyanobacteria bacterium UBA11159]HBS68007.1 hypothetical protein [Cyanobacteria bacterium UBA11153]HBW87883.1 hypothetical protein [Cyanobacteria bacterium UBA11149]HCA94427.1 hypothetical protein [Cyanobacteria bacterium UBA9226]